MRVQVDICNLALSHIGVGHITSLSEDSEPARQCEAVYDIALDAVLRAHDWKFASKTETLSRLADEEQLGWEYVYQYPSNALFIREVKDAATTPDAPEEFDEVLSSADQKVIVCNLAPAYVRYTARVSNPDIFDALFVEVLAMKLAAILAHPLTGKAELGSSLHTAYLAKLEDGKLVNKSGAPETVVSSSRYLKARG